MNQLQPNYLSYSNRIHYAIRLSVIVDCQNDLISVLTHEYTYFTLTKLTLCYGVKSDILVQPPSPLPPSLFLSLTLPKRKRGVIKTNLVLLLSLVLLVFSLSVCLPHKHAQYHYHQPNWVAVALATDVKTIEKCR